MTRLNLQIREWTIEEEIGRGAMGVLYSATHKFHPGEFAIKSLRADAADAEGRARFVREASISSRLRHPNIVECQPAFEEKRTLYLPMERLHGNSLRTLMKVQQEPWPLDVACAYIGQAARGLAHAHEQGILHRDIKPGNIFVLDDGKTVKLVDFGLAKAKSSVRLTITGSTLGTPNYMAPEIIDGQGASELTDIYALGVVLFRLLTRQLPFVFPDDPNPFIVTKALREQQAMKAARRAKNLRPGLSDKIDELIAAMLESEPKDRPQKVGSVVELLGTEVENPPEIALSPFPQGAFEGRPVPLPWELQETQPQPIVVSEIPKAEPASEPYTFDDAPLPMKSVEITPEPESRPMTEPAAEPAPSASPGALWVLLVIAAAAVTFILLYTSAS